MDYDTSPMIWCEDKYIYSEYIAELWNSVTSLIFTFLSIYGYIYHKDSFKDRKINLLWVFFGLIGITSFIFHTTLSFFGQFIDEVSINIFLTYALVMFYKINIINFWIGVTFLSLICWYVPQFSPFILLSSGFVLVYKTRNEIEDKNEHKYWNKGFNLGVTSIFFWIIDFICYIPTHMIWHILIAMCAYYYTVIILKRLSLKKIKISGRIFPVLKTD